MAEKTKTPARPAADVLVSPDGSREWAPEDPAQATNLRARGWKPKAAVKTAAAPAPRTDS